MPLYTAPSGKVLLENSTLQTVLIEHLNNYNLKNLQNLSYENRYIFIVISNINLQ